MKTVAKMIILAILLSFNVFTSLTNASNVEDTIQTKLIIKKDNISSPVNRILNDNLKKHSRVEKKISKKNEKTISKEAAKLGVLFSNSNLNGAIKKTCKSFASTLMNQLIPSYDIQCSYENQNCIIEEGNGYCGVDCAVKIWQKNSKTNEERCLACLKCSVNVLSEHSMKCQGYGESGYSDSLNNCCSGKQLNNKCINSDTNYFLTEDYFKSAPYTKYSPRTCDSFYSNIAQKTIPSYTTFCSDPNQNCVVEKDNFYCDKDCASRVYEKNYVKGEDRCLACLKCQWPGNYICKKHGSNEDCCSGDYSKRSGSLVASKKCQETNSHNHFIEFNN